MAQNWLVLLPPLFVLIVAFIKRNVILALAVGILTACLIATDFSIIKTFSLMSYRIFEETHLPRMITHRASADHVYTFIFLITLGMLITLITQSGGMSAYSRALSKHIKSKRDVETSSLLLSLCFFIDDYLSNLMVGSIMQPLMDKYKVSRAKFAFLIDSMASALCLSIPASSWIALVITQLGSSGIKEHVDPHAATVIISDPFSVYLHSMPYLFYPILLILSSWFIVRTQISYGAMAKAEKIANDTGNLFLGKEPLEGRDTHEKYHGELLDFALPLGSFLSLFVVILLYTGSYLLNPNQTLLQAIYNGNSIIALFVAAILSLIISILFAALRQKLTLQDIKYITISGFNLMRNSLIVLLLAWTFGTILAQDLHTGQYVADLLLKSVSPILLPVMVFITAAAITASTGSAWGTIALVTPLAMPAVVAFSGKTAPITANELTLLYPVVGALLSGAIAGGHISPISDSTVMSSLSSGCYQMDHLSTQVPYVLPVIIATIISLIISPLVMGYSKLLNFVLTFGICLILLALYFTIRSHLAKKNK